MSQVQPSSPSTSLPAVESLARGFVTSYREHPARPALEVGGSVLTYAELMREAATLVNALERHDLPADPPLTAIFGRRSKTAYAGLLAALLRGHGYVPLNPTFPAERTRLMLRKSECRAIVVDHDAAAQLPTILQDLDRRAVVVLPDHAEVSSLRGRFPDHVFVGAADLETTDEWDPPQVDEDAIAYILFTSGSTGTPKGVAVAHRNVHAFLDYVVPLLEVEPDDRFSQVSEMTFDVSVFDMFAAWERGACVCSPSPSDLLRLDRFIQRSAISVWFSVPSAAIVIRRLGGLKENLYPTLRVSLFAGEPLPAEIAAEWAKAAPNSLLENWYGPTELTIDCTRYRWTDESHRDVHLGIVPIGVEFPGMDVLVANEATLLPVGPGEAGELLMTGPLMTLGYWKDPERTAEAYVVPPGETQRWYRTGDRVDRTPEGLLRYLGRVDHQIKVRGHRVELGEVEAVVRDESGQQAVVAVGWPRNESSASAIEVFVEATSVDSNTLRERLATRLPYYMVPRRIHALEQLPLNTNGKFDRNALLDLLDAER